jgi:hypothetical protein
MIAKLILTFLLAGVVLYAWHEQRRSPRQTGLLTRPVALLTICTIG